MDVGLVAVANVIDERDLVFDEFEVAGTAVDIDFDGGFFQGIDIDLVRGAVLGKDRTKPENTHRPE